MSEYVNKGMETVRQGGRQRGCIFSHCAKQQGWTQSELWRVYETCHSCALGHWPTTSPCPLHRAAPRLPAPLLAAIMQTEPAHLWQKVERGSVHWKWDVDPTDGTGYIPTQLSRSRSQTWMARMWPVMQKSLQHIDAYHNPCVLLPPHDFCANSMESKLVISFQIKNIHTWSGSSNSRGLPYDYSFLLMCETPYVQWCWLKHYLWW